MVNGAHSFSFFLSFFLFIGKSLANLYRLFTLSNPLFQLLLLVFAELEVMMSGCQLCHHYINQYRDLFGLRPFVFVLLFPSLFTTTTSILAIDIGTELRDPRANFFCR